MIYVVFVFLVFFKTINTKTYTYIIYIIYNIYIYIYIYYILLLFILILILNDIILKLIYLSIILYTKIKKTINHDFFDQQNVKETE